MSVTRFRVFIVSVWLISTACGHESSTPTGPSSPTPTRPDGLVLDVGTTAASLSIDRSGGPGLIHYRLCYNILVVEGAPYTTKTIQHVEYWVIGTDGSIYENKVHGSSLGEKFGGVTGVLGFGCKSSDFDDRDLTRPTAVTYRVRLEYTFDGGSPSGIQVVTAEKAIASSVPVRPLMTRLTMTTDLPSRGPDLPPRRTDNRQITFTAAGEGGRPPYQYQWRHANRNVVLRDWSQESRFVWDGVVPGDPSDANVTVLARSAGGSEAEVMNNIIVILR